MNAAIQKPAATLADYKAAEERLRQTQAEASVAFNKAQEAGDLAKGTELIAQQSEALKAFKTFRAGIPGDVLLSINADRILESFSIDTENFVNLVIPPDISDEDAMHALNKRFHELFPGKAPVFIHEIDMEAILSAGAGSGHRARGPRVIKVIGVVLETQGMTREQQADALQRKGLTFAHPIEQALAAAAFACKNQGGDLFKTLSVRGSVPEFALINAPPFAGVVSGSFEDADDGDGVAASGSPSSQIKTL
jgi:hypothetical protein